MFIFQINMLDPKFWAQVPAVSDEINAAASSDNNNQELDVPGASVCQDIVPASDVFFLLGNQDVSDSQATTEAPSESATNDVLVGNDHFANESMDADGNISSSGGD